MTPSELQLVNLYKYFGNTNVLHNVNLSIDHGESLAIIGGSGSGKTVMLKCILGLHRINSGKILWQGNDLNTNRNQFYQSIGVLFQGSALLDSLPVWQNVAFSQLRGLTRINPSMARKIAEEKLERVGLGNDVVDLFPAELSGGMQKRVGLARAIFSEPDILFFDEPTTGLDPERASMISNLIKELITDHNVTALTVSHDMKCVRTVANMVAMLSDGDIAWKGTIGELGQEVDGPVSKFIRY